MNQGKDNTGITLLHKGKKSFFRAIFSRLGLVLLLMLIQILFIVQVIRWCEGYLPHI